MAAVLDTLCITNAKDLGPAGSPRRKILSDFLMAHSKMPSQILDTDTLIDVLALRRAKIRNCSG
jgi:hypothetical protein